MIVILLLFFLSPSFLLAQCPTWWFEGVEHGSCAVHTGNLPLFDTTYLECFYRFIDFSWTNATLPQKKQIIKKEEKCEKELRLLLATSPINKDKIKIEFQQRGFRTAFCAMYLHFLELKSIKKGTHVPAEIQECPRFNNTSSGSLQNQSEIVKALATDWKSLSHQLRKEVSSTGPITHCYKFWTSLAQIIESVLITDCDVCNVCDNYCPTAQKPESPLPKTYTESELAAWENYLADKLDYCPQTWKDGIPWGSYDNYYEIEDSLKYLDIRGTSYEAAYSRSQFVERMVYSKFITCQIQTCACPNLFFDNQCYHDLYFIQVGLGYKMTYFDMPWEYMNCPRTQRVLYDSFKGVQEQELFDLMTKSQPNPEFKLSDSNAKRLIDGTLADTGYSTYLMMVNHLEAGYNMAIRTALVSINQKQTNSGRNPTNYLKDLGDMVSKNAFTPLLSSLKSQGYHSEADIITYSLLPSTVSLTQLNLVILVDRASDDKNNGTLVKAFLKNFTEKIHLDNSYFSLLIMEFQNSGSSDPFSSQVLLNYTSPTMLQINKAIDSISLDPSLGPSPFSKAYKYVFDLHKQWNPGNQQVVIMVTSAGLDSNSQEFLDTYQVLNHAFMEYDMAVVGVGPHIYSNFQSLLLMAKNVKSENFPLAILQKETDIGKGVDTLERFLHFVTTQARQIELGDNILFVLSEGQYIFFKIDTLMSTEGIHLELTLPKGYTEVFASLKNEHPSRYDFDFQMELQSAAQEKIENGDTAKYILNIPIYTYEIEQMIALQTSQGFSNWKRHIYIGVHALMADYVLIGHFTVLPGTHYPLSYYTYLIILGSVLLAILALSCICFCVLCRHNCCHKSVENTDENILHSSLNSGGNGRNKYRLGEEQNNLLDTFLGPEDRKEAIHH